MNRLVITPAVVERDAVLALTGELDMGGEEPLAEAVEKLIDASYRRVVLDCTGVAFCDSRGFNALLAARQATQDAGGALALAAISERLQSLLALVAGEMIFNIAPTVEQARLLLAGCAINSEAEPA
ncbi:STAS domain-containing protein [Streptomyces sp. ISL-99]|uniref:STAS domain-containing protein n=1 Tax=Streptomyces sp. ISL-99 TaxID=2819193 RepID=UPI001BEAF312|nr:STAS domain-containing protein [Streptomyces sp. ISL-99]MBT2529812.1 STAS domain-containing protein [Streptomyces sp. ISL-99]